MCPYTGKQAKKEYDAMFPPIKEEPKLTAQQRIVVDYLKEGRTLTNIVAISCLGVGSLSSRVAELRKLGYDIEVEMDVDRFERHFKKYRLAEEAKANG